jgi:SAM-dependent methyltransferase
VNFFSDIRRSLSRTKAKLLRRYGLLRTDWETSLPEEVNFWAKALADPAKNWDLEEFSQRTNPELPLQQELRDLLGEDCGHVVRILDVGAGPLTRLGKVWRGKTLEIVATDPLAPEYDRILREINLQPLVRTIAIQGEKLTNHFAPGTFDIAYASNSLDHTENPLEVIRQMAMLVKVGGYLYLWHFVNCGIGERYSGLHQWNFDGDPNDLLIDDGRRRFSTQTALGAGYVVRSKHDQAFGHNVIVTTIRRLA